MPRRITRSQVADLLGVSISTVRRLERDRLHPEVGHDGAHYFDPVEVTALGTVLATERRPTKPAATPPTPKLTAGEVAARAFECFERRYSLAEVVIALRVDPKMVRELFHEWLVSLTQGELRRSEVALPPEDVATKVTERELSDLLARLPPNEPTRISVARFITEYEVNDVVHLEVVELGGFLAQGPLTVHDLVSRYGRVAFRVSAYSVDRATLRWEVILLAPPTVDR